MNKILFRYFCDDLIDIGHTITNKAPIDYPIHIHDKYEIYYFLSGNVTYSIEGQGYLLEKNDLLLINTGELHRPIFNSSDPYERITLHFKPEYISSFQEKDYNLMYCFERRKLGHHNKIDAKDIVHHHINHYFDQIKKYGFHRVPESDLMVKTYFIQLLVSLNQIFTEKKKDQGNTMAYDEKIVGILDYINTHLHHKITLDLLEEKFYVNKYYLCHLFKQNTGVTVGEYIAYKRILRAKELLITGTPVLETCHAVGFGDYSNFYKTFKRLEGISPKEYGQS